MPATKKRTNVMLNVRVLKLMDELIPNRKRSEFINEKLEEALIQYSRETAAKDTDLLRKKLAGSFPASDEELKKQIRYGLE